MVGDTCTERIGKLGIRSVENGLKYEEKELGDKQIAKNLTGELF